MLGKLLAALMLCVALPANALTINLTSKIENIQVVPPTPSIAFGAGVFSYDTVLNVLSFSIVNTNVLLSGPETTAQLHGPAAVGANGPAIADIALGSLKLGSLDLSLLAACVGDVEQCETDLLDGLWYVLVSSEAFPEGEVRGQIIPAPEPATLLLLGSGLAGLVLIGRRRG